MCDIPARVLIAVPGPDGSVVTRSWTVCSGAAERLATGLGEAHSEMLADASAVAEVGRLVGSTPGVVRAERAPR